MARKRLPPNDPREWLNRARSNLARAQKPLEGAYLEDFCFDAQQAAEKAIKAVFMACGLTFPFIHDLGRLLALLVQGGIRVPKYVIESDRLTSYAVTTRYPACLHRFKAPTPPRCANRDGSLALGNAPGQPSLPLKLFDFMRDAAIQELSRRCRTRRPGPGRRAAAVPAGRAVVGGPPIGRKSPRADQRQSVSR